MPGCWKRPARSRPRSSGRPPTPATRSEARTEIAAEKEAALRDVRKEVAVLSVSIAEKILRKELAMDQEQREYIDRMVEETVREEAHS